jgi:hypothetical protein
MVVSRNRGTPRYNWPTALAIEAWAIREGVRVAAWCTDHGVRSVSPVAERPALRAALAALSQHPAGVFVVARRDRIARDVVLAASVQAAVAFEAARVMSVSGEGKDGVGWCDRARFASHAPAWARPACDSRLP